LDSGAPLSKDAVSRLVGRLREDFAAWAKRDLGELRVLYTRIASSSTRSVRRC
jgi:transposase-like protein